jgi:pentatricopeptide repeat protein
MKAAGFSPNQITYTPVVDALFKLQRDDEAMEMFDEMRSQGVQPLSMTYGVMLVVCSRNDMVGVIFWL